MEEVFISFNNFFWSDYYMEEKDILVIIIYNANYLYWETPTKLKPKRKKLRERSDDSYW